MVLRLREVSLTLDEDESLLPDKVGRELGIDPASLRQFRIVRKAVDARKKPRVLLVYTVEFELSGPESLLQHRQIRGRLEQVPAVEPPALQPFTGRQRVLVVGMGPAGLFAAHRLCRYGFEVTLVERGRPLEERVRDVERFWRDGVLDPVSNVQFGEGGAGTFSDGKLTTRLNHPWIRLILETLVSFGAPAEILIQAKPHVGTDVLRRVLVNFRRALQQQGVEIRFESRLSSLAVCGGRVRAGILNEQEESPCDALVLAPGHSARDTYRMLADHGVQLEQKPFAVGVRVEHPSELINFIQYGHRRHPRLPTADYALSYNDPESGRGVYSFCMCPGGEVIVASSEEGGVVVNGMSNQRRDGAWSNSALVVAVGAKDFDGNDPLAGVRFQRRCEEAAFRGGGFGYRAPAQNLLAFLGQRGGEIHSTCRPGVTETDLTEILPSPVTAGLRRALPHFNRQMRGFVTAEATLVGVETRTSAPVRILRGEDGQSLSHPGLFPAGEGAGYAGGIVSAALDGLKTAELVVQQAKRGSQQ